MKNKVIFIVFIITFSIFISYDLLTLHKTKAKSVFLKDFSNQFLIENDHFKPLISVKNIKIKRKEILIKIEVTDTFTKLQPSEQFGFLSYYAKSIRYYLRNELNYRSLETEDIHIVSKKKDQTFKLSNIIPNKKVIVKSESELYINNKLMLGSNEYKILVEQFLYKYPQFQFIDEDLEIVRYASKMFNNLTVRGRYYNHDVDSKVILDLLTEKFGITEQEYDNIYKKYLFLIE